MHFKCFLSSRSSETAAENTSTCTTDNYHKWPISCIFLLRSSECERESELIIKAEEKKLKEQQLSSRYRKTWYLQKSKFNMAVPLYDTETECHGPIHVHATKFTSQTGQVYEDCLLGLFFLLTPEQGPSRGWEMADKGKTTPWTTTTCHQCRWSASRHQGHPLSPLDLLACIQW